MNARQKLLKIADDVRQIDSSLARRIVAAANLVAKEEIARQKILNEGIGKDLAIFLHAKCIPQSAELAREFAEYRNANAKASLKT